MLKLHELEISGFKSFVDDTRLRFAGGITAIVGPNGCGKSNLSDAITWVLGEQSVKSLRGAKMEDIIFSGSENRKPVGMAEVHLTFETDPSFAHAVDGKITIGRRVFRTGQSQYRINDKTARLKEIKDLLMDTGLGIRAYSVIEQGKIGMILSTKPAERRKLLEEAAGITRYKQRKRIAEVKLEEAMGNLLRLDDIISEVDRALRSLKRQAASARRYQEREKEYRELLRKVLLARFKLVRLKLQNLDGELDGLTRRDAELTAGLSRDEAALAEGREELDSLASAVAESHQKLTEIAATIEGRQEFLKGARQRHQEMEERLVRGQEDAESRATQRVELRDSLGNLDERTVRMIEERDAASRQVAQDEERITAAHEQVKQAETRLESLRRELMGSLARVNQIRSQLQHEQVEIEKRTLRRRFLEDERGRLDRQLQEAEGSLEAIQGAIVKAEERLGERTVERGRLSDLLDALLRREAEISDERRRLENQLAGHRQRREILIQLSEEHAARRRSLIAKLGQIGLTEPRFLAEAATPLEGWESAIDLFLGELADAVVLGDADDGLELAHALSQLNGSGVFLQPAALGRRAPRVQVDDPAVRAALAEALGVSDEIARALPPAFLVEEAVDARRLAALHPGVAFLSRDRLWALGGTLRVQGREAAPGVLARQSELDTLEQEIPQLEDKIRSAAEIFKKLVEERTQNARTVNRLDDEIAELRREIAVGQARRQDAAGRREKLAAQHRTVNEEQEELARELDAKSTRRAEFSGQLEAAEKAHGDLTESFDRCQHEVETAREEREALRTAGAGNRGKLELLEERLESQSQATTRVQRQMEEMAKQLAQWNEEKALLERRRDELAAGMESADLELQGALERRSHAQDEVLAKQERLDERRDAMRELDGRVQEARSLRDDLRSQIERQRVSQAGVHHDVEHLAVSFREEFHQLLPGAPRPEPEELEETEDDEPAEALEADGETVEAEDDADDGVPQAANDEAAEDDENEDGETATKRSAQPIVLTDVDDAEIEALEIDSHGLAKLEAQLSRLKEILERLGPVNVLAATEYEEQEDRGKFLKGQRRDVAESVQSLKETIREINEASSTRFLETFRQVNRAFGEVFQRLFRGGDAEMSLYDEEDLLETGIEIIARPPGKRPQNINLLSGGEKALTAVALLFALFQSKPSPFCILDEVDAPLDDVNVLRFVDLLKEMAKDTQFLVVSHNKLTMEAASTLYGVTMEERGISKLVSAELDEIQPLAQTA